MLNKLRRASVFLFYQQIISSVSPRNARNIYSSISLAFLSVIVDLLPLYFLQFFIGGHASHSALAPSTQASNTILSFLAPKPYVAILLFCFTTVISSGVRFLLYKNTQYLSGAIANEFSERTFSSILSQGYLYISRSNPNKIVDLLTVQTDLVSVCTVYFFQFLSGIFTVAAFSFTLFAINPSTTFFLVIITLLAYSAASFFIKPIIISNSPHKLQLSQRRISLISNTLSMYRDIYLDNRLSQQLNDFSETDRRIRLLQIGNQVLGTVPKYVIESTVIAALLLVSLLTTNNLSDFISILAPFVFSIQRLLPSAQQIFASYSEINSYHSSLALIADILRIKKEILVQSANKTPISFSSITIRNLSISYPQSQHLAISNLTFRVEKSDNVAIVGPSGSGKTTLLNSLMAFIEPCEGSILVDQSDIFSSIESQLKWQNSISLVPQKPFIFDSSLLCNITNSTDINSIDKELLAFAFRVAYIDQFCALSDIHNFLLGNDGSLISGGQAQRISLARAIYQNRPVLSLDEFTSALDQHCQDIVLDNISTYLEQTTIFMITHRREPLSICNKIISLHAPIIT